MDAERSRTNLTDFLPVCGQLRTQTLDAFSSNGSEPGFLRDRQEESWVLYRVDAGGVHVISGGQEQLLQPGDLILFAPGQWHVQYGDVDAAAEMTVLRFSAEGRDLSALCGRRLPATGKARTLLEQMLEEQRLGDECSGDMILALLAQLLLTLQRDFGHTPSTPANHENAIILQAQKCVSHHILERLSVSTVARMVGVSPSYLTALFDKHLSISPGEYIRRCKLQKSKELIQKGDMSFTQIAEVLQYSTVHHFSRQFKEKFGITPSQYAKSVR